MTQSADTILVLNSGSSSLKFGVFVRGSQDEQLLLSGAADEVGRETGSLRILGADGALLLQREHILESQPEALRAVAKALHEHIESTPAAVGHRIVHGGPHLREHQRITDEVLQTLEASTHFAPVHIPQALRLVKDAEAEFAGAAQFACFDTAFHRTLPEVARRLPIPARFDEQGVMRYGFHGLSVESVVRRLMPKPPVRVVVAHLGNGSSVTAVQNGRSIDTSMGLTPTGGVPMSTRSGDLDPGVLLYLMRNEAMDAYALERLLNRESGLAGLSNGESDMVALLSRADQGDAAAELAVNAFCTGVRKAIGADAALMGGIDLLVFTGGIGEHSEPVRKRICDGLEFLGGPGGAMPVVAMRAEEEVQIARHVRTLMSA